jgi:FkbH-like protein
MDMDKLAAIASDSSMVDRTGSLDNRVTESDIEGLFQAFLGREVGNADYIRYLIDEGCTVRNLIKSLRGSEEFAFKQRAELNIVDARDMIRGSGYRIPTDLRRTSKRPRKVLLVGSCLLDSWSGFLGSHDEFDLDFVAFNNASTLPELSSERQKFYDFQICQIPLRSVLKEADYFSIRYDDAAAYDAVLGKAKTALSLNFCQIIRYNTDSNLQTFILNFVTPQQNPMGRLQQRYYLGNLVYFIEELNRYLSILISETKRNIYMIDFDQIASTFGKKYCIDDVTSHFNHSSFIGGLGIWDDSCRFEPIGNVELIYAPEPKKYVRAVLSEAEAGFRTVQQLDSVKLVIFDLDDTLWRGVGADYDNIDGGKMIEGWPLSIVEAASYLWRRGILIAIVSKNDEKTALSLWEELYGSRFSIKNFVAARINWNPKSANVGEILTAVNLLPGSVLFVDDNPVERAAVKAAFPDIRVIDASLAHWRRLLLWAPELQQAVITGESSQRTETTRAQMEREDTRQALSRDEFLNSLSVTIEPIWIASADDPAYARCFELANKTNQFNTTGRRWSAVEIAEFFAAGGRFLAFRVRDKYAHYGLTALMLIAGDTIEQFVMSCRVFGLEIEKACLALACEAVASRGAVAIKGKIKASGKNVLSMTVFENEGFGRVDDNTWSAPSDLGLAVPGHISVAR